MRHAVPLSAVSLWVVLVLLLLLESVPNIYHSMWCHMSSIYSAHADLIDSAVGGSKCLKHV